MNDKPTIPSRLELQDVSHAYGDVAVLSNINISVQEGEILVIVGPSGCGKTTLLNLMSGHQQPKSGKVHKNGVIRTIYQQGGLFPWLTVQENIAMGFQKNITPLQQKEELQQLLDLIRLNDFANHYPHELSGGMKQRVEIARALAGNSDLLMMDEPFSALDYQSRLRMRLELIKLLEKHKRTVVFVTHDIEEAAQLADRVLILSSRPATICRELRIEEPRPRDVTSTGVIHAMKTILNELGL